MRNDITKALRDYAEWTREANDDDIPRHRKISILDMDDELLDKAADLLDQYRNELTRWRVVHNQSTDDLTD